MKAIRWAMAALTSGLLAAPLAAQTVEEFYADKDITFLVAAAPGGMADTVARSFAEVFATHVPGNPAIIVQNLPGAGGLVGASNLQNAAPKDGSTVGFLLGNVITTPRVTQKEAQFDPRTVEWLGAINSGDYPYALYAFDSSPVQAADGITGTKMVVGSTSFTNYNRVFPAMINAFVGSQFDIVSGYKGSGEVYLAMERGEVDGWFEGTQTLRSPIGTSGEFIEAGKMKPILLMASETDPRHPELPVLMDLVEDDKNRQVVQFMLDSSSVGRPLAVPAGVPEDRVAALRQAMSDTFADPALAEAMGRASIATAELQTYEQLNALLAGFYDAPEEVVETVRGFMVSK